MKRLIIFLFIFVIPASAYTIDGEIYSNDTAVSMANVTVNIQNYTVTTNTTGMFLFTNSFAAGNYTVNLSNTTQPRYQNMAINITLTSNLFMSIAVPLKPTGTITGRVCSFPGCAIADAIVVASNRIRWFF